MSLKPDFTLGFLAPFRITTEPVDRLRNLGLDAANSAGIPVVDLSVEAKMDAFGELAYFFRYVIEATDDFDGKMRMRLLQELRDRLLKQGDEHYPFVEIGVR